MKLKQLIAPLIMVSMTIMITSKAYSLGEAGTTLNSQDIKNIICQELEQVSLGIENINKKTCLASLFQFYQKPNVQNSSSEKFNVEIFVEFALYGTHYKSTLATHSKSLSKDSNLSKAHWTLIDYTEDSYEDEHYLWKAWRDADFIQKNSDLYSMNLTDEILKSLEHALDSHRPDIKSYYQLAPQDLKNKKTLYHVIKNPNTHVILGFIIESGYTHIDQGIDVTYEIKLDAKGNFFDEDIEHY